jgi:lipopolysaccharide export system protein LptA
MKTAASSGGRMPGAPPRARRSGQPGGGRPLGLILAGGVALAGLFPGAGLGRAQTNSLPEAELGAVDTNSTVITSTRLNYDQQKQIAVFEDKVVVTDPRVKITADKLTVFFVEEKDRKIKPKAIEAEGSVVIREGDKTATGEKARYEIEEGKFVLTGNPRVQNGRDVLTAGVITFWRNTNRIQCEKGTQMTISTEKGGGSNSFFLPKE